MVSEDREILMKVWEGTIPCLVHLAEEDASDPSNPPAPFCIMLPRQTYLPLASEKIKKHFSPHLKITDNSTPDLWFSCNGTKLRWHYPVGLLFDLLSRFSEDDQSSSLPWKLTVHFSQFPLKEIMPCNKREVVQSLFLAQVKEADQVKHLGKVMSQMQAKDHTQLFLGLAAHKFEQFWAINRRLMVVEEGQQGEGFRHLPLKVYTGLWKVNQKLVAPCHQTEGEDSKALVLEDLVTEFNLSPVSRFLIQGIFPSPDTPLLWLVRHLAHPDNFLHVVVLQDN